MPFSGSDEERRANRATHDFHATFYGEDDCETRCFGCDCRPSHACADYVCGYAAPRTTYTVLGYGYFDRTADGSVPESLVLN